VLTALYSLDIYIKYRVLFLKDLSGLWSNIQFWTVSKNECEKSLLALSCLRETIPLCVKNIYRKNRRTQQKVIYCYTGQPISTQLWGHHQASD
jgi:hypothetical protein